jgi:hypothetical protein
MDGEADTAGLAVVSSAPCARLEPAVPDARPTRHALPRLIALLGTFALLLQAWLLLRTTLAAGGGVGRAAFMYLGYFTLLTNGLCTAVAIARSGFGRWPGWLRSDWLLTSATCSILVVALVYEAILRALWQPQGAQWLADLLLHTIMPLLMLVWWWRAGPYRGLAWGHWPWLLGWPVLYLVYVFARGALSGDYPYPFIDARTIGWAQTLANAGLIALLFGVLGALAIGINRRRLQHVARAA